LHIDSDIPRVDWKWKGFSRWKTGIEFIIDEKAPDVSEGDASDEILDIDTAVTERATFLIWFGDL
jgi:hypothetical protein